MAGRTDHRLARSRRPIPEKHNYLKANIEMRVDEFIGFVTDMDGALDKYNFSKLQDGIERIVGEFYQSSSEKLPILHKEVRRAKAGPPLTAPV